MLHTGKWIINQSHLSNYNQSDVYFANYIQSW